MQVELAYDWRSKNPARFDIGPVLDRDDVVTGKVLALSAVSTGQPRVLWGVAFCA
ncbi:MAG: hypothetical protein ACRDSR_28435 [Pseudonocardiaceae bacterium]